MADWNPRANDLFLQAAALNDLQARQAFLDRECGNDQSLRGQVVTLLQAHERAGAFLEEPHPAAGAAADRRTPAFVSALDSSSDVGTIIAGKYKLLQAIGEGGMGSVFMADQTEPVKRRVALKLIRAGMDSRTVLARFEAERQALALMDHPNIAKVLDAGTTEAQHPYFVMELVKGVPINQFCDEHKLSITERLHLFTQVCSAVQHAHQKGIIHRDLKPSNVLVESHDGKPVPKVIDFGLAKAMSGQPLTENTLFTALGSVAGTPLYMAPEQAAFNAIDVDTRADIYALGVILYELLTGTTPIERGQLKKAAFDEILRVIRESEPPTPSKRLTSAESKPSVAACRQMEPAKLGRFLRGDLDWIVMKALAKERDRRYETANGFAKDIERFLNQEPVVAGPPSASYRMRKFVQRNRRSVTAAGLVLLVLVGGIIGTTWGLVRAQAARNEALTAQQAEAEQHALAEANARKAVAAAEAEKQAKETAQAREAETKAVLEFVQDKIFAAARPKDQDGGQGYDVKLADALKAALPYVEKSFAGQPLIEAGLRMTLGRSFWYLGEANIAAEQFQRARMLYTQLRGPDDADTLRCANNLANSYSDIGRYADALKLREETFALLKSKLGAEHPDTLTVMSNLANTYDHLGRHGAASKLKEETLALRKAKLGPHHRSTLVSMTNLAVSYGHLGRYADALSLTEEALSLQTAELGPDHPEALRSMTALANIYYQLGRYGDALKLQEKTWALKRVKLGPEHPETLVTMDNLVISYARHGRHADALKVEEETLSVRKARLGPVHPDTLTNMNNLANRYGQLARFADAVKLHEETLALRKAKLGPDHPDTLSSMFNLANSYDQLGRHADAVKLSEERLAIQKTKLGPDHPDTLRSMNGVALMYAAVGRLADALKLHEETLALYQAKFPENPDKLSSIYNIGCVHALMAAKSDDPNKEAELAMDWLKKAVAAGFKDVEQIKKDTDLDPVRARDDFKKLVADLEQAKAASTPAAKK